MSLQRRWAAVPKPSHKMLPSAGAVARRRKNAVRTQDEIRQELDRAIARRRELWRELGHGRDAAGAAEVGRLTTRIAELWEELRIARTRERFGSPELIVKRAEVDRRLERELDRRIRLSPRRAA
jgi:hypothetical protein